jgi:branched-chain amino acid aminotransferase
MYVYVNGEYVPEEEASVSVFDRGLQFGDGVFDTTRTFDGQPFRLEEHLRRLGRSLRYIELDGDSIIEEVREAANNVTSRNLDDIRAFGDGYVMMIVTRGPAAEMDFVARTPPEPTIIVMNKGMNFAAFAHLYERGADLGVSLLTSHFCGPVDARVKATSRGGYIRADLKMLRNAPGSGEWALIFNPDGSIAEAKGANLLIYADGELIRPFSYEALEGVGIATACELAADLGVKTVERRVTAYDVLNADEVFLTASSFCILPVRSIDGIEVRRGEFYSKLLEAFVDLAGMDFVKQAQALASGEPAVATPA